MLFNPDTSLNTVRPLHLNYATTLPRKTITTKITIFIIVKRNMEIWHFRLSQLANSSKPCENGTFVWRHVWWGILFWATLYTSYFIRSYCHISI